MCFTAWNQQLAILGLLGAPRACDRPGRGCETRRAPPERNARSGGRTQREGGARCGGHSQEGAAHSARPWRAETKQRSPAGWCHLYGRRSARYSSRTSQRLATERLLRRGFRQGDEARSPGWLLRVPPPCQSTLRRRLGAPGRFRRIQAAPIQVRVCRTQSRVVRRSFLELPPGLGPFRPADLEVPLHVEGPHLRAEPSTRWHSPGVAAPALQVPLQGELKIRRLVGGSSHRQPRIRRTGLAPSQGDAYLKGTPRGPSAKTQVV